MAAVRLDHRQRVSKCRFSSEIFKFRRRFQLRTYLRFDGLVDLHFRIVCYFRKSLQFFLQRFTSRHCTDDYGETLEYDINPFCELALPTFRQFGTLTDTLLNALHYYGKCFSIDCRILQKCINASWEYPIRVVLSVSKRSDDTFEIFIFTALFCHQITGPPWVAR